MKQLFLKLDKIYTILFMFQIITAVTIVYWFDDLSLKSIVDEYIIQVGVIIEITVAIIIGNLIYGKNRDKSKYLNDNEKKYRYGISSMIRMLLLYTCNLSSSAAYLFTGDDTFLLIILLMLVLFFIYRPNEKFYLRDFRNDH